MPVSLESITQYVATIRVHLDPNNDDSPAVVYKYKTNVITSDLIVELEEKAKEETEAREGGDATDLSFQDLFNRWILKRVLVSWDIVDSNGETIPITVENLGKLDLFYRQRVYNAIRESLSTPDPTTKKRSSSS